MILLRFRDTLPGIWTIRVRNLDPTLIDFHAWLPAGDIISEETFFINSNPDVTVTSPGNSVQVLTVAAYNQFFDSILIESGKGYNVYDEITPDIAAPGFQIPCAVPVARYGTATGTGSAAAHTTGAMAMIMEWGIVRGNYPSITGTAINHLIIRGARHSEHTTYPNNTWGYGQLDVINMFRNLTHI